MLSLTQKSNHKKKICFIFYFTGLDQNYLSPCLLTITTNKEITIYR